MANETATLAAYVADLKFADIPPEVLERAKVLILDFLGSTIRARRDAESTASLLKMLEALALDGKGESTVFGDGKTWTPAVAALLNGALGHSLDFDDTHAESSLHPSAPVVPAAFAVGEMVGASGRDVLTAIVAGYEVCCRLGNALDPTSHYARGFHPTATAGTYGAAAAAGKLFGLSKDQIISAFGVSGSQAAGSLQFLVNGAWNKRYQVGAAAMNGVIAATLARNDFVGSTKSVEGKHGLLVGYSDNAHPDKATAGLGKTYETNEDWREAVPKLPLHPCRAGCADRDAPGAQFDARPDQARRDRPAPQRHHTDGRCRYQAASDSIVGGQFSMFFTGALALDQGSFGWDDYDRLGDAAVNALADKFDVVQDDRLEIGRTHPFGARVSITTDDGVHERLYADPSGEPNSFPDAQAMQQKFLTLARPVLNGRADQLADAILSLERFDRVAKATQLGRQYKLSRIVSLPLSPLEMDLRSAIETGEFFPRSSSRVNSHRPLLRRLRCVLHPGYASRQPRSIRTRHLSLAAHRRNHIAHEIEHAVGFRRPVRRAAEPDDHQPLRRHDDHILPDRPLGEKRIARPAVLGAVGRAKAVAEIGPESGALADPGVRRRRRRILHPSFRQDAFAAGRAVIEIELAEARPVTRARQHLARSLRIARGVEFERDVAHAERIE